MKLIVMVPCLNEEATLPKVINSIPSQIAGISKIETLIVDDGSTDDTVNVARRCGVHHIVRLKHNMGLAKAFQAGIDACLDLGADLIVNTDGDNQYPSEAIPALIEPILEERADITIGDRQTQTIDEFSTVKKLLERLGSWMVRTLAGVADVPDAVSGFRAYSRNAASRIYLIGSFSYTIESVILAGKRGLAIESVPIVTNAKTRPSRLYRSVPGFITRSAATLIRSYTMYEPLKTFLLIGMLSFLGGLGLGGRFIYFVSLEQGQGHVQSLILASALLIGGLVFVMLGVLADLIASNRKLLEEMVWREKAARNGLTDSTYGIGVINGTSSQIPERPDRITEVRITRAS